jgi:N-methylhydantoinase B/oxoprolinase/acetone carboxylase alpha subunit
MECFAESSDRAMSFLVDGGGDYGDRFTRDLQRVGYDAIEDYVSRA